MRQIKRAMGMLAAGLSLSACGFTPLYASGGIGPALDRIEVIAPKGRTGFLLGQHLDDQLARDRGDPPKYSLLVTLRQTRYARGVRVNSVANRYEVILTVGYVLTELQTNKRLTAGTTALEVSYDSADPPYAGVAAEQDAEDRGASQAAVLLRLELSRYFAHLPGK